MCRYHFYTFEMKKNVWVYVFGAILILGIGGFFYLSREKQPDIDFTVAKRADISSEVSVTGRVVPVESVRLAFEKSGKVVAVFAGVGDIVNRGAILVQLEQSGSPH